MAYSAYSTAHSLEYCTVRRAAADADMPAHSLVVSCCTVYVCTAASQVSSLLLYRGTRLVGSSVVSCSPDWDGVPFASFAFTVTWWLYVMLMMCMLCRRLLDEGLAAVQRPDLMTLQNILHAGD